MYRYCLSLLDLTLKQQTAVSVVNVSLCLQIQAESWDVMHIKSWSWENRGLELEMRESIKLEPNFSLQSFHSLVDQLLIGFSCCRPQCLNNLIPPQCTILCAETISLEDYLKPAEVTSCLKMLLWAKLVLF